MRVPEGSFASRRARPGSMGAVRPADVADRRPAFRIGAAGALRGLLPGDVLVQNVEIQLPDDLPAGTYALNAGLYSPQNGQRLREPMRRPARLNRIDVQPVSIVGVTSLFRLAPDCPKHCS